MNKLLILNKFNNNKLIYNNKIKMKLLTKTNKIIKMIQKIFLLYQNNILMFQKI